MNRHLRLVPILATVLSAALTAAETGHDDHGHHGHDHHAPPAAAPAKAKPHIHGAHEHGHDDDEDEDDHGHGHDGHEQGGREVTLPAAVARAFGISSEPAQARSLGALVLAPGQIVYDPAGQAQIAAPAAGRIVGVRVQAGDAVKAGDPLIELASPAYGEAQSAYVVKRAAATAATYHVETAREALDRGRKAGEGLTGAELKRREADVRQAEIAMLYADAELAAALSAVRLLGPAPADLEALTSQGRIADTLILRAPIAGTISERAAVPGQQVPGDAEALLSIADTARLWVVASIPESSMAQVRVGSRAELHAFDGARLGAGDIVSVTPDIDPRTRTGRARLAIAGSPAIRSGMHVQVRITPPAAEGDLKVVTVPESAVMTLEGRSVVFVAEPGEAEIRYRAQPVMPGPAVAGIVPILTGLESGTPVVVQGAFLLKADLGKGSAAHEH